MRSYFCLFAIVVAATAGCTALNEAPNSIALGVLILSDSSDGAGGYLTSPSGVFWTASNVNLPVSDAPANACIDTLYFPPDSTKSVFANQLDAGSPIQIQSSVATGILLPDTIPDTLVEYVYHGTGFHYVPGGNVTFTIPGSSASNGFAQSSIAALTPKVLILGPIPSQPVPTDSMRLAWVSDAPGVDAVNIYLIYESSTSLVPDRQIICSSDDNGVIYVPIAMTAHWDAASTTSQAIKAFRWVTTSGTTSNGGELYSYARFDTTAVPAP